MNTAQIVLDSPRDVLVGMGQVSLARGPACLRAVLGSCIGVTLHHPRLQVGVLAHVVLPEASGRTGPSGKFADTAVPHMLELLREAGVPPYGLNAKLSGGANMFGTCGPIRIGEANAEAVRRALRVAGISVVAQDVGGQTGRRVTLDCASGDLIVEIARSPHRVL